MSRPPCSARPPTVAGLTRRGALGSLAALALAGTTGCSVISGDAAKRQRDRQRDREDASAATTPEQDPDVELAVTVLALEIGVLQLAGATLAAFPSDTELLGTTVDVHAAHVALLEDAAPDAPSPSAGDSSPSPEPAGGAAGGTTASPSSPSSSSEPGEDPATSVPGQRRVAFRRLARAEEELALALKQSAFSARSGGFARVLASMAAAAGQQAVVLRGTLPGGDA